MQFSTWKKAAIVAGISTAGLVSSLSWAQAQPGNSPFDQQPETRLACERLKAEIDSTIRNNGAQHFLLEIVDNAQVDDGVVKEEEPFAGAEVVGSCDGGTRKVVYSRDGATEMSADVAQGESAPDDDGASDSSDGSSLPETAPAAPESRGENAVPLQDDAGDDAGQEPESSP
ncbi:DUF1161 domain-containing protein [Salinicola halimionae]|uniref:DUF1161 domain-containing protein n=1 Tax=Salinicola halimionae TaxID=1949081 RepID=UPI000DA1B437|nr:DUF1161 domain-containing protein [Salinicola halimionae]